MKLNIDTRFVNKVMAFLPLRDQACCEDFYYFFTFLNNEGLIESSEKGIIIKYRKDDYNRWRTFSESIKACPFCEEKIEYNIEK